MQYLGGYVLHKVHYKIREMKKSEKTKQAMTLILALRSLEMGDTWRDDLSRGGALWKISDETSRVFIQRNIFESIQLPTSYVLYHR